MQLKKDLSGGGTATFEGDSFGSAGTDKRTGQVIGEILQLIKSTGIDPADVMEEIGQAFGVSFEFGRAFEGKDNEDDEQDMADVKADIDGMMEGYMKERAGSNLKKWTNIEKELYLWRVL